MDHDVERLFAKFCHNLVGDSLYGKVACVLVATVGAHVFGDSIKGVVGGVKGVDAVEFE